MGNTLVFFIFISSPGFSGLFFSVWGFEVGVFGYLGLGFCGWDFDFGGLGS